MSIAIPSEIPNLLLAELDETRERLREAEETLDAIRSGAVDGLMMTGPGAEHVYTLHGAQETYRLLIERMSEGAFTLSREGDVLYANESFARMLRRPMEHVLAVPLLRFLAPASQPMLETLIAAAWGGTSSGEISLLAADDSLIPVRLGLSRVELEQEVVLIAVATDLTGVRRSEELERHVAERTGELYAANCTLTREVAERKRAEEMNWRYAAIVASSEDSISSKTLDGLITSWNPSAEKIFGYTAAEMIGQRIDRLFPAERKGEEEELLASIRRGERVDHFETVRVCKDGRHLDVSVTLSPILDAEGHLVGVSKIAHDITGRKRIEEDLRRSEEMNRQILASTQDYIKVLDLDGILISMSKGDPRVPEIDCIDRYLHTSWMDFWHPEDHAQVRAALDTALAGDGGRFQAFCPSAMGTPRWWDVIVTPIRAADGRPERLLAISRDITAHKQIELTRQSAHDLLEQRVEERTAELLAANKELEAFSYTISHDLRAPLRAIDGYSHVLVEDYNDRLDEEGRRVLGVVRSEAQRMGRLIDELLIFFRVGRQVIEPRETDMHALAMTAYEEAAALGSGRKITAEIALLPVAHGEPVMLRQVWANLVMNAVKFTRHCDAAFIQIGATQEQGETIYFVRDNGAGFDMAHAGKLFGVFQRLHGEAEFEGTGVGLAFVKRIILRHGGRVWAEGAVDRGATFFFALPDRGSAPLHL